MAIPSINNLIRYINTKLTGANWNTNFQQILNWFTDGNADVKFNSVTAGTHIGKVRGDLDGNVVASDGITRVLYHGTDGTDAQYQGAVIGDIWATDGTKILENGTDGTDATFTGDVTGDVYASNGTSKILDNGTDGTNAEITADVVADDITTRTASGNLLIKNSAGFTITTFTNALTMQGTLEGTMKLIKDVTVSVATNEVELTSLNGNVDEFYELIIKINSGTSLGDVNIRFNNDSASNYNYRYIYYTASAFSSSTASYTSILGTGSAIGSSNNCSLNFDIFAKSGTNRIVSSFCSNANELNISSSSWNNTADNLTSIKIIGSTSTTITVGSRILLYAKR